MLSNLRFNVLASVDENATNILFRLVPRTSGKGGLHFKYAHEISFILGLADVNVFPAGQDKRTAHVTLIERYRQSEKLLLRDFTKVHNVVMTR